MLNRKALLFILTIFFTLSTVAIASSTLNLSKLIREVEEQYNGKASHSMTRMEVATEHWQRSLTMEAWSLGRDYFLMRIVEPSKERGVATLKADREVWNYLPKVDRTIKIPPSMMGGAWMGSHITNDDLVKANHIDEDFDFSIISEHNSEWLIEGIPKPDAAVIWGKIVYLIEKERRLPLKIEYFDEEMVLVRTIEFSKAEKIDGRFIPLRMVVIPNDKPQERTVMEYDNIDFDVDLDESFFSLRSLKRRK